MAELSFKKEVVLANTQLSNIRNQRIVDGADVKLGAAITRAIPNTDPVQYDSYFAAEISGVPVKFPLAEVVRLKSEGEISLSKDVETKDGDKVVYAEKFTVKSSTARKSLDGKVLYPLNLSPKFAMSREKGFQWTQENIKIIRDAITETDENKALRDYTVVVG